MGNGMVSAVCINRAKKEILLVLNTEPEKPLGFWGLPGGKMKEEEAAGKAVIRELIQETNQEGEIVKHSVEISKTGSKGEYIHHFVAVRIVSFGKELKNYENPKGTPEWIPLQKIITGEVKMFRGHIQGLILILEKITEETLTKNRVNKHGIKIISECPPFVLEMLNELKSAFNQKG